MSASAPGVVRAEQVRMVLEGVGASLIVGILLPTLLVFLLGTAADHRLLLAWYIAFLIGRFTLVGIARWLLRSGDYRVFGKRVEHGLAALKIYEGCAWGALLWIALPSPDPAVSIVLIALLCALCGNAVALLAPLRDLYLALALPMLGFVFTRFWVMGTTPYQALSLCCILYVGGLYGQARIANRRIREGIKLQFENARLVDQLRQEMDLVQEARLQAERANAAKSTFLAAASHDLRQPVHALGLFLEALAHSRLTSTQRRTVESAQNASLASSEMLNTLLDFSRIEAGVIVNTIRDFPLQPLLDKLEFELAPMADAKALIYRARPTSCWVRSDVILLEQILRNIISNAIRYTQRGGIVIGCRRRNGGISIEVYDTGIGIAADQQADIFSEFLQLGNPERDRQKGLGLGLAIVHRLAASLGHSISLSSVVGRGSVFRVGVPMASGRHSDAATDDLPDTIPSGQLAGRSFLVVDDDAIVRAGMSQLLESWDCVCLAAGSEQDAILLLSDGVQPDAIICDYRLQEGRTGAEAVATLRHHLGSDIPALLITGDTAPERLREASRSGLLLMHKPVLPAKLYQYLCRLIDA
ncbi:hybrid sensor histidine kinase/response regulator [Sphingomonas sp.]|uniref:ATP-binding response regulator n=1 Tax=Sphingomonas sp. TaxID=28214 RepID=UPI003B3B6949